ncbi:MAG: hypothetical protein J6S96_02895 [Muribaculaceae bacterium]|nr:hypothetical protein [Muribaculaceae bacterium]
MKKIKYFVFGIIALAMIPSCREQAATDDTQQQDSINTELNDSLATVNAEKDSLMALMMEINDGMAEIKRMEDIVTVRDLSHETPDRKQQLRDDIVAIQKGIAERQKKLAELEKRLKQSTNFNDEMKKTIEGMKKQLATQQSTIDDLTKQLAAAHVQIDNLNTRVDSLKTVNTQVNKEKTEAQEESKRLENELNTCYYAIGSNKELKANNIIEKRFLRKTKIMEGDFEKSYFTKADKRTLNEIPLHSKKAEVMSKHPADSYSIVDVGGTKKLVINDSRRFWEYSNYLVVKIN